MRVNKIDKPGKVYVVTKKTKAGSSGTASAAKKVSLLPCGWLESILGIGTLL